MNFRMHRAAYAAAVAMVLSSGAAAWAADDVIATMGSDKVTASEVKAFISSLPPAQREQAMADPKIMDQVLRAAIGRRAILKEAEKQSWPSKPDVAEQIERARREVIISTFLQSVSAPPASFPSDEELKSAYQATKDRLMSMPEYHLAQIFVAVAPGASKDVATAAERKAADIAKKAKTKGTDFAELARSSSEDKPTAEKGGDLGWLPENQILPGILQTVRSLGEKGVSAPVRTTTGWHIVQVVGVKPSVQQTLAQVHDALVAAMRQSKTNQNAQAYADKLLDDQHLAIDNAAAKPLFTSAK